MFLDIAAPWIIDAWRDALESFALPAPTIEIERDIAVCAIAGAALVLTMLVRRCVRHLPTIARRAALLALLPVMAIAVVAAGDTSYGRLARSEAERVATRIVNGPEKPERDEVAAVAPKTVAELAPPAPIAIPPREEPAAVHEAPPPPPPAREKPSAAQSAANAIARVATVLARKAQPRSALRVIPVLFGTDRVADKAASGLDYTAERAGRLVLGRALVTEAEPSSNVSQARPSIFEVRQLGADEVGAAVNLEATSARRAKGRALVYVHGLNTSFKAAVQEAVRIAEAARFDGAVLVYSWPSAGHVVQYAYDAQSAAQGQQHLADFLTFVQRQTGVSSISIVADGLGAAAVVDALDGLAVLKQLGEKTSAPVGDLVLRAPDMDRARFAAKLGEFRLLVGKVTLYAAASDRALNVSRRYVGAAPRAGDVTDAGPLVLDGVDTVDVTEPPFDPKSALKRDDASASFAVLARRLGRGADGAGPELESVDSARGAYWRLKAVR